MYATAAEQRRVAKTRELAATLYVEHRAHLMGVACANSRRRAEAEDAVQEAMAIFVASYDPASGSPPLPWLTLTLKRVCWAMAGRQRAAEARGIAGTGYGPDTPLTRQAVSGADIPAAAERAELKRRTREGMRRLQPEQRRALSLLALGYSYREIAERLGLSEKQVDHRLSAGRTVLRAG